MNSGQFAVLERCLLDLIYNMQIKYSLSILNLVQYINTVIQHTQTSLRHSEVVCFSEVKNASESVDDIEDASGWAICATSTASSLSSLKFVSDRQIGQQNRIQFLSEKRRW